MMYRSRVRVASTSMTPRRSRPVLIISSLIVGIRRRATEKLPMIRSTFRSISDSIALHRLYSQNVIYPEQPRPFPFKAVGFYDTGVNRADFNPPLRDTVIAAKVDDFDGATDVLLQFPLHVHHLTEQFLMFAAWMTPTLLVLSFSNAPNSRVLYLVTSDLLKHKDPEQKVDTCVLLKRTG